MIGRGNTLPSLLTTAPEIPEIFMLYHFGMSTFPFTSFSYVGATTYSPIGFRYTDASNLKVILAAKDGKPQTLKYNVDYTVDADSDSITLSLERTWSVTPTKIFVLRDTAIADTPTFQSGVYLDVKKVQKSLETMSSQIAEIKMSADNSMKISNQEWHDDGGDNPVTIPPLAERKGHILAFDDDGNVLMVLTKDIDQKLSQALAAEENSIAIKQDVDTSKASVLVALGQAQQAVSDAQDQVTLAQGKVTLAQGYAGEANGYKVEAQGILTQTVQAGESAVGAISSAKQTAISDIETKATSEKQSINTTATNAKSGVNTYIENKKTDLADYVTTKKGELTSHETSLEGVLDTYTAGRKTELNTYTSTKEVQLDTYTGEKKSEIDSYISDKKDAIDAVETRVNGKAAEITSTASTVVGQVTSEGSTQKGLVTAEGTTQVGKVTSAGTTEVARVQAVYQSDLGAIASDCAEKFGQNPASELKGDDLLEAIEGFTVGLTDFVAQFEQAPTEESTANLVTAIEEHTIALGGAVKYLMEREAQ